MAHSDDLPARTEALAASIRDAAARAASEEDLRVNTSIALHPFVEEFHLALEARFEHGVQRGALATGRADAVYGGVYFEYKRPGRLASDATRDEAVAQVQDYLHGAWRQSKAGRWRPPRLVGVVTDGKEIIFVRPRQRPTAAGSGAGEPTAKDVWSLVERRPVDKDSVALLLHYLRSLDREPLTAENLAKAFGPTSDVGPKLVAALYTRLRSSSVPLVETMFREWERIFGIVYGQDTARASEGARILGDLYGVPDPDLKRLFFCVHTYYALVMKVLAVEVASLQAGTFIASFAGDVIGRSDVEFDRRFDALEDGSEFRRLEITNYLEGDFFRWYLEVRDADLRHLLREFVGTLSRFEPATASSDPDSARDILKHLYQYLVPRELRHDLGEYYTPDWLADFVLDDVGYEGDPALRVLDPACGSGTFLALEIARIVQYADDHFLDERDVARQVVRNIVGFDLNPLAVLAARTTFLLALGPLLRHVRPLEIPVYFCDSVLLPKPEGGGLFTSGRRLSTSVGTFTIPGAIDTPAKMARFAEALETAVRGGHTLDGLAKTVERSVVPLADTDLDLLRELYARLCQLAAEGRNGIWPRIIKNGFAPVFVSRDRFDLVVGNPPWVNWESLSDEYRRATKSLWRDQGLFSLRGHEARLGGGKKDLSMLMTYEACQDYLRPGGTLAFLITQTVFKSGGAGAGFRRFRLSDTTSLKVLRVHDMTKLQPFEGAANRTAAVIIERDAETTYPVRWVHWETTKGRRPRTSDALADVLGSTSRTEMTASPVRPADKTSAWLTLVAASESAVREAIGQGAYRGYTGAYTGGLDGAYYVEILTRRSDGTVLIRNEADAGRIKVPQVEAVIEPNLLYPLLRGRDVQRWHASPSTSIVLSQDPENRTGYPERWMQDTLPLTYEYLLNFKPLLAKRRSKVVRDLVAKGAFYSMYAIGRYTLSEWKTVFREQSAEMAAAVVGPQEGRPVVPNHKLTLIPTDGPEEAHYLCAVLNSAVVADLVRGYGLANSISAHVLNNVKVPRYDASMDAHRELAALALTASEGGTFSEARLSELVSSLWV